MHTLIALGLILLNHQKCYKKSDLEKIFTNQRVKLDRINDAMSKEEDKRDRATELYLYGRIPLSKFDEVEAKVNAKIYALADQEAALEDEYNKAIASDMSARLIGSSGEPAGQLDAERLRDQVGSTIKQITVESISREDNPQYAKNKLDFLHKIDILGYDEKCTTYILASGTKKVFCEGKNILTKPESIFI